MAEIHDAVEEHRWTRVAALIAEEPACVNERDCMNNCPLHIAARTRVKGVRLLLDAGADVNAIGDMGRTPLLYASQGHVERSEPAKVLLKCGAIPDTNAAVWLFTAEQMRERLEAGELSVTECWNPQQLVNDATMKNDADLATLLFDHGAPIDGGPTCRPILTAFIYPAIAKLLLERGADPNVKDSFGDSMLQNAIDAADAEIETLLREYGAKDE